MAPPPSAGVRNPASALKSFRVLRLPLAAGAFVSRTLLVKKHEERDPAERKKNDGRTLFVTHIDGFTTEAQLARCFQNTFGPVETIELKSTEKKAPKAEHKGDRIKVFVNFARVVFKEASSLQAALKAATGRIVTSAVLPPPTSQLKEKLRKGKQFYADPDVLRKEVDDWMLQYDQRLEEEKRAARENQVDEDGFTKVISGITRTGDGLVVHSAKRPALKTGAFAEPLRGTQDVRTMEKRKKRKSKEQPDFYRFQLREQRKGEVEEHRKRKAEAQDKVERTRLAKRRNKTS